MTKHQFKICEAVALGLDRYYMEYNVPSRLTERERQLAARIIPTLPKHWMRKGDTYPWSCMNKNKRNER